LQKADVNSELLRALLLAESVMIKHALEGGRQIATSLSAAPSEAVKALATFGAKLTEAFNSDVTTLLGPGIQALGTRVFLAASRPVNPDIADKIEEANAILNLEFMKPDAKFDTAALLAAGRIDTAQLAVADRIVELQ